MTERLGLLLNDYQGRIAGKLSLDALEKAFLDGEDLVVERISSVSRDEIRKLALKFLEDRKVRGAVVCGIDAQGPADSDVGEQKVCGMAYYENLQQCAGLYSDADTATAQAERRLRVALAHLRLMKPVEFRDLPVTRKTLVIGAGPAAMDVVAELVSENIPVLLLLDEKGSRDGDACRNFSGQPLVEILESAKLRNLEGQVGHFKAAVECDGSVSDYIIGAVVVAPEPVRENASFPEDLPSERILGLSQYEKHSDKTGKSVVFWLDREGFERNRMAENVILQASERARSGKATVLCRNVPLRGLDGQKKFDEARKAGVNFIRLGDEVPKVTKKEDGIRVSVADPSVPDYPYEIDADWLVIPERELPDSLASFNKALRQPLDHEGYLQPGNVRWYPLGAARKGIFHVGAGHTDPDGFDRRMEPAVAVSEIRKLFASETLRVRKDAVHVDENHCASCLTCLRLCPHGAIEQHLEKDSVTILEGACEVCGICAGCCPGQAIVFNDFDHERMDAVLRLAAKTGNGPKPILVFGCSKSAAPSLEKAANLGLKVPERVFFIEVPCTGRVDETAMMKALSYGAEQVIVVGCHEEVCRSLHGNIVAANRVSRVRAMLREWGRDPEKIRWEGIANNEAHRLVQLLKTADSLKLK